MAFLDSYDEASIRPDEFWQDRARGSSVEAGPAAGSRQFVAITEDGTGSAPPSAWSRGPVTWSSRGGLVMRPGGHVVGVFLCPGARGRGLLGRLFQAVTDWLAEAGPARARLYVHADNIRAQRAYEKLSFTPTGTHVSGSIGTEIELARTL
jgi:GNAT superfamily N-acetyltransferase